MTTTSIHDASNKVIASYEEKQKVKLEIITMLTGKAGANIVTNSNNKLTFQFNGFTIFVKNDENGYRIQAYQGGMEKYDFYNQNKHATKAIINLIATSMKAGN